jgi:hypothetical protein
MGLFNPKLQETSGSSVTQEGAVQTPNIVGEVANVVQQSASIFAEVGKAKEEGASNSFLGSFTQQLGRIAERAEQQADYSNEDAERDGKRLYTKAITNSRGAGLVKDITKIWKGVSETTGAFEAEKSEQEQIRDQSLSLATAKGYVNSSMTDAQINKALGDFTTATLAETKNKQLATEYSTKNAKSASESAKIKEERQEASDKNTRAIFDAKGPQIRGNIINVFNDKTLSPQDKVIGMDKIIQDFEIELRTGGSESQAMINTQIQVYKDIKENYSLQITDNSNAKFYKSQNDALIEKGKALLLQENEDLSTLVYLNELTNNAIGTSLINNKVVARILGGQIEVTEKNTKPVAVIGTFGGDKYVKALNETATNLVTNPNPLGNMDKMTEEAAGLYNNLLLSTQFGANNPKEWVPLVESIASIGFADLVKKGLINSEALIQAKNILKVNFEEILAPRVQDKINEVFTTHSGTFYDNKIIEKGIREAVDIEISNDGKIGFVSKKGIEGSTKAEQLVFNKAQYQRLLRDLNTGIGKVINRQIRSDAHLNNSTDYRPFAEQALPTYLGVRQQEVIEPEKSAVEEVEPTTVESLTEQAQAAGVDLSTYEDADYSNGTDTFTVKGGKIVGVK